MKVLFLTSTIGNGGIQSWAKNYLKACSLCELKHIQISRRRSLVRNDSKIPIKRIKDGIMDMIDSTRDLRRALEDDKTIDIIHSTTSGGFGTFRDYFTARIAHKYGVKIILHCHYGSIPKDYKNKGFWGWLLRKTLLLYDQIWVLDSKSVATLNENSDLNNKVKLVPNFIDVPEISEIAPKHYFDVAFVGNLLPSKGLYELVEAVASMNNETRLSIVGPGKPAIVEHIKKLSADKFGKEIKVMGQLPNDEAVKLIAKMDIIALPTYFPAEAFPISILEAMSRGKLVVSTKRAAIPDILTDLDGNCCGKLVAEGSIDDIVSAIIWCQVNSKDADMMCVKAYEKVKSVYQTDVILNLYYSYYKELTNSRVVV